MEFVFRRISNALKFKEDEFMKALYAECQLKISGAQPQNPVCFALLLDLAGNVLANELSVEDDSERTKRLRKMITETFHAKQLAVRGLESTMSRADFSSLKTEVLSCIIDELIPLRGTGEVLASQGEEEVLSVEEMFRRKDKEIQNANALVIEMESRMKQEWEALRGETASIIADMQRAHSQQVEALQAEAERESERSTLREREWALVLEKREVERAALEQKQYQQQEWALEQQEAKWKRVLAAHTQDLASERANMERQMELNFQLQLEEAKQRAATELDEWKLEHTASEDQQYSEWKQEYVEEQEDLYLRWKQEFLDEQEQANAQWKAQQEEANLRWINEQTEANSLWKQQQEAQWAQQQGELQESWKRGFVAQQDEQNDLWRQEWALTRSSELKREWDAEQEEWKLEMVNKAREIKQEYLDEQERANAKWRQQLEADLRRDYETQQSQLRNELASAQQALESCKEQFELDEILLRERADGMLASAKQQSVLDKVSAIEAALKQQRVQFEEERAKTVSKLCAGEPPQTPQSSPSAPPPPPPPPLVVAAPAIKQADLRRLLEEAQTVHRQLEAITFTLRSAKPTSPPPPRRLTQVSSFSFHTPLDKRQPRTAREEGDLPSTTSEAEKLEARLMDEVVLETSSLSTVAVQHGDKPDMSEVDLY